MSELSLSAITDQLKAQFPDAIKDVSEFRDEVTVVVDRSAIVEVATYCRDTEGLQFDLLADLTGVDYWPDDPRFAINYHIYSLLHNQMLRLKVFAPDSDPVIPSVVDVWPGANWPEREVFDMLGVKLEGHPDLRRILMPFDWTGHPQRKDYPLGYEEVQFSFNYDRVQAMKPQPKE